MNHSYGIAGRIRPFLAGLPRLRNANATILFVVAVLLIRSASILTAQKLDVKIIDRQNNGGTYTYVVPGYSTSSSNANLNCNGIGDSVNCNGSAASRTSATPALVGPTQGGTSDMFNLNPAQVTSAYFIANNYIDPHFVWNVIFPPSTGPAFISNNINMRTGLVIPP